MLFSVNTMKDHSGVLRKIMFPVNPVTTAKRLSTFKNPAEGKEYI